MIDLPRPLFSLGRILVTPAAHEAVVRAGASIDELVERHVSGDWGDVDVDDANANVEAVSTGARILSAYALPKAGRVWVMTEAMGENRERPATTVLLPNEY